MYYQIYRLLYPLHVHGLIKKNKFERNQLFKRFDICDKTS